MEVVAARLGDHVDRPAGGAAVLCLVPARLDLDLLDELSVDVLPLESLDDAGRVDPIDQEEVLRRGRTVDRDGERAPLSLAVVGLDARLREQDRKSTRL